MTSYDYKDSIVNSSVFTKEEIKKIEESYNNINIDILDLNKSKIIFNNWVDIAKEEIKNIKNEKNKFFYQKYSYITIVILLAISIPLVYKYFFTSKDKKEKKNLEDLEDI